jgi:hypothetical protein
VALRVLENLCTPDDDDDDDNNNNEAFALLECYAALIGSKLPTFRDDIGSIFKGQKQSKKTLILQDETDRLPETLVTYYQSTLRNMPEERRSHLHHGGSLKSRNY